MMPFYCRFALIFCAVLLAPFLPGGKAVVADNLPPEAVRLQADEMSYDRNSAAYKASGDVLLRRGNLTLQSESLLWDSLSGNVLAEGGVHLEEPEGTLDGERLRMNIESGVGAVENARIFLRKDNFHLAGESIEKTGEQSYRIRQGTFTTCDGETPSWKFGASDLKVTLGGFARGKHVVFYLHDLPVLYLPYVVYPVQTERSSGFLMPSVGYSDKRGTQVNLAYYQVIARNQDATFYLDYLSRMGLGKGLEYRYIFGRENEGEMRGYHISSYDESDDRYAVEWTHYGFLPGRFRLAADVEYVSSRDYFEDFGDIAGEYNKDQTKSTVYVSRSWGKTNGTAQLQYIQVIDRDDDSVLQRLPEVRVDVIRQRMAASPFYLQLDTSSNYFWRKEGLKGERLDLRPVLAAAFRPWGIFDFSPELAYRQRFYWTSDGEEEEGLPEITARLSTRLSRVYSSDWGSWQKIRHSVEPEILYRYIPEEDQSHLPYFDVADRIWEKNHLVFGLTNRWTARIEKTTDTADYLEFLYLRLSQAYDIEEARRDLLPEETSRHPFSPLRAELILRPSRFAALDLDASYDFDSDQRDLVRFNARGSIKDSKENALAIEYRQAEEGDGSGEYRYLGGTLDTGMLAPIYVRYEHRRDLLEKQTLENLVDVEYRSQCWSLFLTYRDRLDDSEIMLSFSLSGLGRFGGFSRGLESRN
ncbi:LPS assembly protein LptD [Desulfuromonas sp. AOP6]|uniref:LPS-assembly protein LptD n=1 Tax=Desulfuromonas sp. AOP6 TaxID=1566351 RepID=UPI0012797851|nr:LPS assembly protein LptD [Desulfuromonas sp. AOP6]BCA80423.1 LPS-assembly protein LptD [Desulfuromonas sp. AOP6]